jgi:hypothetical protein
LTLSSFSPKLLARGADNVIYCEGKKTKMRVPDPEKWLTLHTNSLKEQVIWNPHNYDLGFWIMWKPQPRQFGYSPKIIPDVKPHELIDALPEAIEWLGDRR